MPFLNPSTRGALLLAAGAASISLSPVMVKLAHVGPTAAVFYRNFFGALILFSVALVRGDRFQTTPRFLALAVASGFLFTVDLAFWHRSVHYVGPGLSTILGNFQVFILAAFGVVVLRERFTWKLAAAGPLGVFGLMMLIGFQWGTLDPVYRAGVVFGLITAVAYASYILTLRRTQGRPGAMGSTANMTVVCLAAALSSWPVAHLSGESLSIPDGQTWAALLIYGLMGQAIGSLLISKGLPLVTASKAGIILLLQPTLAFIWDILFFKGSSTAMELGGAFLAMAAIYLGSTAGGGKKSPGRPV